MKKYIAEALGAGILTFTVIVSIVSSYSIPTPVLAALVLGLFVYMIGGISGSHINPAVTIGIWSLNKISAKDALFYIIAQVVGAGLAMALALHTIGLPQITATVSGMVLLAEALGAFFFAFGIACLVLEKAPSQVSGLVIGGSLLLGLTLAAGLGSNGVLNPAVAWGIGSLNLYYILGPIIGSVCGMQAYKYLSR